MRYVLNISPQPPIEIGERKVRAIHKVNQSPRLHGHDHPVEPDNQYKPAPYPDERRKAPRRITNVSVLIDRRSGIERRSVYLSRHIDEEA